MDSSLLLVFSVLIIVSGFILFLEWRRVSKKHLAFRFLSVVLISGSLFLLIHPIGFIPFKSGNKKGKAGIILSPGMGKGDWLNLSEGILFTKDSSIKVQFPKAQFLSNFWGLSKLYPEIDHILIEGYGLNKDDLAALKSYPIEFRPSPLPMGIISCHWPEILYPGSDFWVQGSINNKDYDQLKLILKGDGRNLDSLEIRSKGISPFSLKAFPLGIHRRIFELILLNGKDTLNHEPIPFQISYSQPIRIAFLSDIPNFENRFLKNWLLDKGFEISSKTSLSSNKSFQDQSDRNKSEWLSEKGIKSFDLLITDESALQELKSQEGSILKKAIVQKGMGIIILLDSLSKKSPGYFPKVPLHTDRLDSSKATPLYLSKPNLFSKPTSNTSIYIDKNPTLQALVLDGKSRIKVGKMLFGQGSIIFSCLDKTYPWSLSGNTMDYSNYWTYLIHESLKQSQSPSLFSHELLIPRVGNEIIFNSFQNQRPDLNGTGLYSSFLQDPSLPFLWSGSFWTNHTGWMEYPGHTSLNESIYIYKKTDWLNLEYLMNRNITLEASKNSLSKRHFFPTNSDNQSDFIYKLFFLIIILISFSFLWVEKKFWAE